MHMHFLLECSQYSPSGFMGDFFFTSDDDATISYPLNSGDLSMAKVEQYRSQEAYDLQVACVERFRLQEARLANSMGGTISFTKSRDL